MKRHVWGLALALVVLAGCSQPTTEKSVAPAATTADAPDLLKRQGGPLWNLEYVGPVVEAYKFTSFDVPAQGELHIGGWAVDQEAKLPAGGVEVRIDGVAYAGEYGKSRPDVAASFGNPAYGNAGYIIKINSEQFTKSAHGVYFRVFSNDRKSYWEAGPYTISFK
jgi:hypothetical protein